VLYGVGVVWSDLVLSCYVLSCLVFVVGWLAGWFLTILELVFGVYYKSNRMLMLLV
jgi:hypothetical protein